MKNGYKPISMILFSLVLALGFLSGSCGDSAGLGGEDSGLSVTLAWEAPSTNEDGSPLTDLAGYRIYYGPFEEGYSRSITVGNVTSCDIMGLFPGTWVFAITAFDESLIESNAVETTFVLE